MKLQIWDPEWFDFLFCVTEIALVTSHLKAEISRGYILVYQIKVEESCQKKWQANL